MFTICRSHVVVEEEAHEEVEEEAPKDETKIQVDNAFWQEVLFSKPATFHQLLVAVVLQLGGYLRGGACIV